MISIDKTDETFRAGMDAVQRREFDRALALFRQVAAADPGHAAALLQIGRILISSDKAIAALTPLRKAVEARPGEAAIWEALASAVALGGEPEDEKAFLDALKAAPVATDVKVALRDRFGSRRRGSPPRTGGVPPTVLSTLSKMMSAGQVKAVELRSAKLLGQYPESAVLWNMVAATLSAQKNYTPAQTGFSRAIHFDPNYAEAYENLGFMMLQTNRLAEAIATIRTAVTVAPGRVPALRLLGDALVQNGEPHAALPLLRRALREDPRDANSHVALGNAYARALRHEDAEQSFRRAVDMLGDKATPELLAQLGSAEARIGRDDAAMKTFAAVLKAQPDNSLALSGVAGLLQSRGDFDGARDAFRRAIVADPLNGENYRQLAASYKMSADDPLLAEMRSLHAGGRLSDNARMNVAFAIAKGLEDARDYGDVFRYLDEANALMRAASPYSITKRHREVSFFKHAMGGFDYHAARVEGTTDFAPIFVTGMPRSGTTLVEQIISSHSTVTGAGEQSKATSEANALLARVGGVRTIADVASADLAAVGHSYAAAMRSAFPGANRLTDKAISTFNYIGLLRLAMPQARFIVVRRDPRDTLLSIYKNKFPDGTHGYAYDQRDLAAYYGTFVEMVEFWRGLVPDWFYEVQYEDLVANPEEEARKLIAACGLEWEDACLSFHENKRKVQTLSVYQVRQPISSASVQAWQRYETEMRPMIEALREAGHVAD